MRAAGLDLNEQGDVWARVAEHRAGHLHRPPDAGTWHRFTGDVRHLLHGTARTTGDWHAAYHEAGTSLHRLRATGKLTRGLRAVVALHAIFHWNRLGLPATTQAALAHAAKEAIFGTALPPTTGR
jgi:thiopeptide-type bacteriocin biosynthesis protein